MRLLLDTHIFISILERDAADLPIEFAEMIKDGSNDLFLSVASIWEIAIKHRLGKLALGMSLDELPVVISEAGFSVLEIRLEHVLAEALPQPPTRDPFDRLLLAQCQCEGLKLVTLDRSLSDHPLSVGS